MPSLSGSDKEKGSSEVSNEVFHSFFSVTTLQRVSVSIAVFAASACTCFVAHAQTKQFDGTAAIAAGSINPPDPVEGCNKAKRDAEDKASKAGTKGFVSWEKLSVDSDCKLTTPGARGVGYFFIFSARGNFTI